VIELTRQREAREWSRNELGRRAHLHPTVVGQIELCRFRPYPGQLDRLARALKWDGLPEALLKEVNDDVGE